jgi:hypothetical protein
MPYLPRLRLGNIDITSLIFDIDIITVYTFRYSFEID